MKFEEVFFTDGVIESLTVIRDSAILLFVDPWGKRLRIDMRPVKSVNVGSDVVGYELSSGEIKDCKDGQKVFFYNPDLNSLNVELYSNGEVSINEIQD